MNDRKDIDMGEAELPFVAQAKAHFDDSVEGLDGATQSRLNRGRQKALAELSAGARFGQRQQWLSLAGVAAAVVFAVVLWRVNPRVVEQLPMPTVSDFELLLDQDEFEMLQELEFYSWIDVADDSGANVG